MNAATVQLLKNAVLTDLKAKSRNLEFWLKERANPSIAPEYRQAIQEALAEEAGSRQAQGRGE